MINQQQGRPGSGTPGEARPQPRSRASTNPDDLVALGLAAAHNGNWGQAASWFRQVLLVAPGHLDAIEQLGTALTQLGKPKEAIACLQQGLAQAPERASLWRNLGNAFAQQGRWTEAEAHFERAAALAPDDVSTHLGFGAAAGAQGKLDEAVLHYQRALALKDDLLEAHNNLANVFSAQGKLNRAITHYRRALAIGPDYAQIRVNLGHALAQIGNVAEASQEAALAAQLRDGPTFPHFSLGMLLAACDLKDAARIHLSIYLQRDPADTQGARMILARLGFEKLPLRAPEALIATMYASRAAAWGAETAEGRAYRGADLVAETLQGLAPANERLDILDAGCGTGLVGSLVAGRARRLDGVDLSAVMIERAHQRGIYHDLHHGDLVAFLEANPGRYDAVLSAATLIHFGDLRPVFAAAAAALRPRGLLVFTVFPHPHEDVAEVHPELILAHAGCFAHGRGYVARTAAEHGFAVERSELRVHERDRNRPRMGLVVGLRKQT